MWGNFFYRGTPRTRSAQNQARPFRQTNLRICCLRSQAGRRRAHGDDLTRTLAQRLARENINVNAIAPGVFPSRLTKDFPPELVSQITSGIPRGRFGTDHDIVGAVIYLTSRAGAYVTSSVLSVDGGWAGIS